MTPEEYAAAEDDRIAKSKEARERIFADWQKAVEKATADRDRDLLALDDSDARDSLQNSQALVKAREAEIEAQIKKANSLTDTPTSGKLARKAGA